MSNLTVILSGFFLFLSTVCYASITYQREFNEADAFSNLYFASGEKYDEIVSYDRYANFIISSERIENNRLVKAVKNNQKYQRIVLNLVGGFINAPMFPEGLVDDLIVSFKDITGMELEYVTVYTDDLATQRIADINNAFEQRNIAVITFGQGGRVPFISDVSEMPADGALRGISVIVYDAFDSKAQRTWASKIRSMRSTSAKAMSLKKYLHEYSNIKVRVRVIRAEFHVSVQDTAETATENGANDNTATTTGTTATNTADVESSESDDEEAENSNAVQTGTTGTASTVQVTNENGTSETTADVSESESESEDENQNEGASAGTAGAVETSSENGATQQESQLTAENDTTQQEA